MRKFDYLIVGAGLFGAVFAQQMKQRGKKCLVVEKRDHIGGNCATQRIEGVDVHRYGAHIFHTSDEEVWNYVGGFARFNRFTNSPIAIKDGKAYNMPFNMNTFHALWGVTTPQQAREKIREQVESCALTGEPQNLEEQALSLVGRDVYETLVRGYTQKQWGRPCTQLPAFIIRRLPVRFTYDNNYFSDRYQGIPEDGYSAMIARMLEGVEVRLGVDYLEQRQALDALAEKTVYTGLIDAFYGFSLGHLTYRSLRFETKVLDTENYQGNAVVNYTGLEVPYTRVIEHKHFAFGTQEKTVVTWEYPDAWEPGKEPYYPVNDAENTALYERYHALAQQETRVIFGGRLAQYRYLDMHHVVREALDLAAQESRIGEREAKKGV